MDPVEQLNVLSDVLTLYLQQNTNVSVPPSDFLHLAIQGMERLHKAGRMNIIYLWLWVLHVQMVPIHCYLHPECRWDIIIVNIITASSVQQVRQHHFTCCIVY